MQRINLDTDIRPLSDFRANVSSIIEEIKRTKRPVVLTQHGRSAAVIIDVGEYERILEKLELLSDIQIAENQLESGKGLSHDQAKKQILNRLKS
ncbi:type II toxin-antitoxin system Phd/YefM family antitoxin [bacterium]|nr:type II toxin-antitoxin system Phd/YefM family antitoxin [bacterium]